jgi:hypothetical protein
MTKKNFIAGLAIVAMLPLAASAATVDELQAQINALMAQLTAAKPTTSCAYTFTKTLKQGISDAEVMNLQKMLNADMATQVAAYGVGSAGNETMYFGMATKAAVKKYQEKYASDILTPNGLSMGTGMVGASTRAKLNMACMMTSATTPTSTVTPVTGLSGGAGSISTAVYSSDTEDNMVTGEAKNVVGWKVQADGSDVNVSHVKVKITYDGTSDASNILNRYFQSFDVYAAGAKVGTIPASDFTRDSAGVYSKTIALTGAIVKMGSNNKATFYLKATGADAIDSVNAGSSNGKWDYEVLELRFTDATGVTLSSTLSNITKGNVYVNKLGDSADIKIKVSTGTANPEEKVVFVSDSASGDKVTLLEFKIKAEGTDTSFDQLKATTTITGSLLSEETTELQLVRGTEVIDTFDPTTTGLSGYSATASTTVVTFDIDTPVKIAKDATETFKIVAKMQKIGTATFAQGDTLKASYFSINGQDKNGDNIGSSKYTGSADGKIQTFRATGLNVAKVSTLNTVNSNNTTPSASYGEFKMQLKIAASGDDIWVPLTYGTTTGTTTGFLYELYNSAGSIVTTGTGVATSSQSVTHVSGGVRDGSYVKIADGDSATFELVVTLDPAAATQYRLQFVSAGYTTAGATGLATAQIAATPTSDFQSTLSYIPN